VILEALVGPTVARLAAASDKLLLVFNPVSGATRVALFQGLTRLAEQELHLQPDATDGVETRVAGLQAWLTAREHLAAGGRRR
jgi:hypothetical protein